MSDLDAAVARGRALRHDLHAHPELAYQEERTATVIRDRLDALDIPWRSCAGTGTVAHLAVGRAGVHRALRADIDALPITEATGVAHASRHPGRMHACGHDGHTAALLTAAELLKAREARLPGPVTLFFQPAEEGEHGARAMIADGCLEGVDEVYGWHNWPTMPWATAAVPVGPVMAANAEFHCAVIGRGGHASQPERCRDPMPVAAQAIGALQTVVSRRTAPQEAAVLSVTTVAAGTATNVIADRVDFAGSLRSATTDGLARLAREAEDLVLGLASAHGCRGTFEFTPQYPATVNHPEPTARAAAAIEAIWGPDCLHHDGLPIMGSEDFSYYLEQVPGCYLLLGSGRPGASCEPCHSPRFDFNDDLLAVGSRLWLHLVGLEEP